MTHLSIKIFGLTCSAIGIILALQDLSEPRLVNLRHENGFLMGSWLLEMGCLWQFFKLCPTTQTKVHTAIGVVVSRVVYPGQTLVFLLLGVFHGLLSSQGVLGKGLRRDIQVCGISYIVYRLLPQLNRRFTWLVLNAHVMTPLQLRLGQEHLVTRGFAAVHTWLSYVPAAVVTSANLRLQTPDFNPLLYCVTFLWTAEWSAMMAGAWIASYLDFGSLVLVDEESDVVCYACFIVVGWLVALGLTGQAENYKS